MSPTVEGVEELRRLIEQAMGRETYTALARRLNESPQWLSNKVTGKREWEVPELVRLAEALGADPVLWVLVRWPDLAAADRLAGLRDILSDATTAEVDALELVAAELVGDRAPPTRRRARG